MLKNETIIFVSSIYIQMFLIKKLINPKSILKCDVFQKSRVDKLPLAFLANFNLSYTILVTKVTLFI